MLLRWPDRGKIKCKHCKSMHKDRRFNTEWNLKTVKLMFGTRVQSNGIIMKMNWRFTNLLELLVKFCCHNLYLPLLSICIVYWQIHVLSSRFKFIQVQRRKALYRKNENLWLQSNSTTSNKYQSIFLYLTRDENRNW